MKSGVHGTGCHNNHGCSDRFNFSNELLSLSVRYTLPALTKDTKKMIEFVTLRFQSLNNTVVVYGYLRKNLPSEALFEFAITFQATLHLRHTL